MPEIDHSKGDVAHHLSEGEEESRPGIHPAIEIVEAILLALVAVATAWSAYQADLWTGHQAELYGLASKLRVEAEGAATVANQERSYDASTVAEWLNAEAGRHQKLADIFQRRFVPEFRPAFEAWKKTDPLNNPNAPAKPELMPEYRNAKTEEASRLSKQATDVFERGTEAREHSDQYMRATVTLATVLFLVAVSQRFKINKVRFGLSVIALIILSFPIFRILTLPRA